MVMGTGGIPTTGNIPETTEKLGCPTDNVPETTEIFGCPIDNVPETTEIFECPPMIYPKTDFYRKHLILSYSFEIKQIK